MKTSARTRKVGRSTCSHQPNAYVRCTHRITKKDKRADEEKALSIYLPVCLAFMSRTTHLICMYVGTYACMHACTDVPVYVRVRSRGQGEDKLLGVKKKENLKQTQHTGQLSRKISDKQGPTSYNESPGPQKTCVKTTEGFSPTSQHVHHSLTELACFSEERHIGRLTLVVTLAHRPYAESDRGQKKEKKVRSDVKQNLKTTVYLKDHSGEAEEKDRQGWKDCALSRKISTKTKGAKTQMAFIHGSTWRETHPLRIDSYLCWLVDTCPPPTIFTHLL